MRYSLISDENSASITVYVDGQLYAADSEHPNFEAIVAVVVGDEWDEDSADLFDVSKAISNRFQALSERVSVSGGHVFFDGDEVHGAIVNQILRFVDEGEDDFKPLVNFMEKLASNPNDHSRTQLFDWVQKHGVTILPDGDIVAYKGVNARDGGFVSCHSGPAIVDGVAVNGYVPNAIGSTVEMARSKVDSDPHSACSTGLHVGNWRYASDFGTYTLKVRVNPRDIVSVPHDSNSEKVRCCRYTVLEQVSAPITTALDTSYDDEEDDGDVYDTPVVVTTAKSDYDTLTLRELRKVAQDKHIRVNNRRPSHCTKAELLRALS